MREQCSDEKAMRIKATRDIGKGEEGGTSDEGRGGVESVSLALSTTRSLTPRNGSFLTDTDKGGESPMMMI